MAQMAPHIYMHAHASRVLCAEAPLTYWQPPHQTPHWWLETHTQWTSALCEAEKKTATQTTEPGPAVPTPSSPSPHPTQPVEGRGGRPEGGQNKCTTGLPTSSTGDHADRVIQFIQFSVHSPPNSRDASHWPLGVVCMPNWQFMQVCIN